MTPPPGPVAEVAPRRAGAGRRGRDEQPVPEPAAVVVPNGLLQLMTEDDAPAKALLWDWRSSMPPPPAATPPPTPQVTEPGPAGVPAATGPLPPGAEEKARPEGPGEERSGGAEVDIPTGRQREPEGAATPDAQAPVEVPEAASPGARAPAAGTEAGGEVDLAGPGGLETWGDRVRTATARRLRAPAAPDPTPTVGAIGARTTTMARREAARRARALSSVKGALPMAPDLPPPPQVVELPRKDVEAMVTAALGGTLPAQTLPELQSYPYAPATGKPHAFKPELAPIRLPEGTSAVLTPPEVPKPRKRIRGQVKEPAAGLAPVAAATSFTLGTTPAPKPGVAPPAPRVAAIDVAGVLARLYLGVDTDAQAILVEARTSLYRGALQQRLGDFGKGDLQPDLQNRMRTAIDSIAAQAGVAAEVVHGATRDATGTVLLGKDLAKGKVGDAEAASKAKAAEEARKSAAADAAAAAGAQAALDATMLSTRGGASPAAIRAQRDRLMARVRRRLAPEDLRYEREGEERQRALELASGLYTAAYVDVARQVRERIARDTGPAPEPVVAPTPVRPPPPTPAPAPVPAPLAASAVQASPAKPPPALPPAAITASPADVWSVERMREVREAFARLRQEAAAHTAALRSAIKAAEAYATRVLDTWVDGEVVEEEGFWETRRLDADAWDRDARDRVQAWEEARSALLGADLRGDIAFVAELASGARSKAEIEAAGALGGLSDAQKAVVAAYFVGDKVTDDPLGAVAAGMRVRVAQIHRPRLVEELDRRLYALPKEKWPDVAIVAEGDGDGKISVVSRGRQFHASVDQWGTDESKLYAALTGLTKLQRHALDLWYQAEHGTTIDKELRDELEDAELDRAQALMAGDEIRADAAAIRDAIEGPGTDEQEIYRALRNKTPDQRAELERIYLEMYQVSLQEDIDSDMDGQEFQRAEALREGDQARADAIGLEMAKTGKWYGGADTDAIQDIYAQNRLEVEQRAQREGWTADRMRQENLARLGALDRAHRKEYKDGENDGAGLEASFRDTLSGPTLDLALGLQQLDLAKADAARLELEKRSFITDDKVVTKILESQYDRAETEARLDAEHRLAYRADLAAVRGERWDEDRAKRERAATEAEVTVEAGRRAEGYMSSLKKTYNDKYATDLMSLQHGPGGFDALLEHGLQGSDEDRAKALVAAHGRLNPAQEIKYAVQGAGTDLDVIKRMLAGKTKEQIREIERQWNELYPDGPSLRDRIMDDVSGRDAIDLDEMLAAPETPREKLESALRRQRFEGETFALGGTFAEDERKALDDDVKRLKEAADEYDRLMATPNPDPQRIAYLKWRADQETKAVDSAVEEHRRAADSVTDKIAMVAAVVAGAIVTAVTWGAAGPFVAGALGALAAAEATIITKMAIKGAAYSEEELLVDVVSGVVDIVLAVATAGIGNAMLRVTKGVPVGRLAAMATSASRAKRMLAHGVANGVEGLISGIPSGAAGALADEKTWSRGDVLGTVLTASAMGAASGAVMGGLMGSAAGWKAAPIPLNLPPGSMPEAAARAAQWRVHQQQHPGAKYADFAADFDAGRIRAAPDAAATFQRAAQDALGSGLTRAERKALDGVSVTVLSDAEFARVTRSKKAQAVTVVENGKPRVVMRESASLAALREEGIHVAQALDPKLAGHFKLLDEAVLAHWDQLPLGTKLAVYAAKLDLEADANGRLLRGLVAEANGLPPGSTRRKALLERAAEVGDTLDTLFQRQRELRSFGPLDRVRAQLGLGRLADRLDQPARLFTKKGTKPARAQKVAATGPGAPASKPRRVSSDPATWGRQPDLTAPRRAVKGSGRSPQAGKPGVISVEQVGEPWREWSHRGTRQVGSADRYRLVAVTTDASPPAGRVKVTYVPETVVRGSRPPRWVRRGSHAAEAGSVAEQASLAMTRRHIEAMRAKGVTVVSLGSGMQNRSGQGFDEVYFEFHPNGRVEVVIVEVKDYSRRRVPLGDFTAVTGDILKGNLARLRTVVNQKRGRLPAELQSLTPSQLRNLRKHVNKATARSGLTLEVRLGATTGLGGQKARRRQDAALRRLQSRFRSRPVREGRLAAAEVDLAGRIAELGLPPASAGRLLDTHFRAVSPADVPDANAIAALAADVVARLQQPATVPGMSGRALPHVLDLSGLDASVATKVNAAVDKALAATGQAAALSKRLHRP